MAVRNDIAHHKDRFRAQVVDADHVIVGQLYWLFIMCTLRLSSAPVAVFTSIAEHREMRWLKGKARRNS